MPLNKLDNLVKNTEGRILYVSPADLESTDSIDNTGNSLARPFKTIQRALIEAARFSYVKGEDNDFIERTTILLMPGEHVVDNRPGFAIKRDGNIANSISPTGAEADAEITFGLNLETNFDLNQVDNILYKFNSVHGGVIIPRGTSIVGLDLRKTKIRPKYVPNPTQDILTAPPSAIFRITGACYFWQFSIFDANETVYTNRTNFTDTASPTFSHHKLTCFEYADGVNIYNHGLTDLDMYYAKLSRAFNQASNRDIDEKYPLNQRSFAPMRPEYEIVGAFKSDPLSITEIISGNGSSNPTQQITVTTEVDHNLQVGTPIRIEGVGDQTYNISTKVASVSATNPKQFTYFIDFVPSFIVPNPSSNNSTVTVETDTVDGASPYIFNISMRSVWGMNGMHADGSKADGFRSMVVAQFTGISLQKDDRSFVKYVDSSRSYLSPYYSNSSSGTSLSRESSAPNGYVFHLDSGAVYRQGWETTHIKITNDAILQIVSVFAIGFNKHFETQSGGDASITNSNSNFGQLSLISEGFKKEAFDKDNKAYITHIIPPRAIESTETEIDWFTIDVGFTTNTTSNPNASSSRLYLSGFLTEDDIPSILSQGYKIGAKLGDKLYIDYGNTSYSADIVMSDANGNALSSSSRKIVSVNPPLTSPAGINTFAASANDISNGEKVIILSDDGDLPENIEENKVYFAIKEGDSIALAASKSDSDPSAGVGNSITVYGGTNLKIISRVTDKESNDVGSPVQFDSSQNRWYINVSNNEIYNYLVAANNGVVGLGSDTPASYVRRTPDNRSLDEKLYKVRVVVPKQSVNGKTPENGFVLQESSTTGYRNSNDFTDTTVSIVDSQNNPKVDWDYHRNLRLISTCSYTASTGIVTVRTEKPHNLLQGDRIIIKNVKSDDNLTGVANSAYNQDTSVSTILNDLEFEYSPGATAGTFTIPTTKDQNLPRFERNDTKKNLYIYRNEVISEYDYNNRDGIYHLYLLSADYSIDTEFTNLKYGQNVVNLYPQMDRDNINDNPNAAKSFALRSPLGNVGTNDIGKSITRETIDKTLRAFDVVKEVDTVDNASGFVTFTRPHGLSGIVTASLYSGSIVGYNDGTYYNVKLLDSDNTDGVWRGATANITISGGTASSFNIVSAGSSYSDGETVWFDPDVVDPDGDGQNLSLNISSAGLTTSVGSVVQFTGSGISSDTYHRISSVHTTNSISVGRTSGDVEISADQYAIILGPSIYFTPTDVDSTNLGISTLNSSGLHGLFEGNRIRIVDTHDNNLGDHVISKKLDDNSVEINAGINTNAGYILKHGLSSNKKQSTSDNENLGVRSITLFDHINGTGSFLSPTLENQLTITLSTGGLSSKAFPIGSYIEMGEEILYVYEISGSIHKVIRAAFATKKVNHPNNTPLKKIKPLAVEFRRPSIMRASGHTFEYLGYGPGNYSTGLPQVQDRTLTEKEEFLSQSQERSAGVVVYTGMNNKGDFYVGNTKKSSSTGEEISFDVPIPTISGEDASRLSTVFDEITIKERLVVEGGRSNQILSEFNGPVSFLSSILVKGNSNYTGQLRFSAGFIADSNGQFLDNKYLYFGTDNDLSIGHDGNNTLITESGEGELRIKGDNLRLVDNNDDVRLTVVTGTGITIGGELKVSGDITAFFTSDERLKDNITPIDDPLAKVMSISGNTYDWNEKSGKEGHDVGVIAQEVQSILPEAVTERDNGYLAVDYHKIVPLLIESIKNLNEKVESLEQRLLDK
jgi:hypothetical protein